MNRAQRKASAPLLAILILAAAGWVVQPAEAAFDAFLKIDGIPGEAIDTAHTKWIDVQSIGSGITHSPDLVAPRLDALRVIKPIDKSSPLLFRACASGEILPRAILESVRGQADHRRFYRIVLEDVLVLSFQTTATAGNTSAETVDFAYGKITWTYTEIDETDQPTGDHRVYWDVVRNEGGLLEVPPFRVSGTQSEPGQLRLSWPAEAGQTYRISSATRLGDAFVEIDQVTSDSDGPMEISLFVTGPHHFFVVQQQGE
jgi:type VI secretion system secreted protein Hcp